MTALRFKLAGVPIRVEPVFFLIMFLIGGIGRPLPITVWFVVLGFVSILFHELAHAAAFRIFGRSPSIVMHAFGGATSAPGAPLSRARDVLVAAVGPLSQILILGLPALALRYPIARGFQSITWLIVLTDMAWINLAWGILNLMPVLPLDGGRIAAGLLGGTRNGMRIAYALGIAVAGAGVAWGLMNQQIFLAMFSAMFIATNVQALRADSDTPVVESIRHGHRSIDAGDTATALRLAQEAVAVPALGAPLRAAANELEAWAHLARGNRDAADGALRAMPAGFERSGYLAAVTLVAAGDPDAAVVVAARAFASEGTPPNRLVAATLVGASLIEPVAAVLRGAGDGGAGLAELAEALRAAGYGDDASRIARA